MTNNQNEPGDVDIDAQDDFDKEPQQKASLKDAWDNNPLLKIAAVVVVAGLLVVAYIFAFPNETQKQKDTIQQASDVKIKAGEDALDDEYKEAIIKENERKAAEAEKTGESTMPVPIGRPQDDQLSIPPAAKPEAADPLQEWRAKAEARRLSLENEAAPPEEDSAAPEVVPMVTPIRPQPTMKLDPQAAKALTQQMQAIIATQAPKAANRVRVTRTDNLWAQKNKKDKAEAAARRKGGAAVGAASGGAAVAGGAGATRAGAKSANAKAKAELIIPAGNIAYAQLLNDLNSDIVGPALAQVMSGPFEGGRAIGQFQKQEEWLTLQFKRIIKDGVSYSINAIAIDEETTLGAHQSDVDHHYFQRVILPMAASFLTGYTQAASQTGTTVSQTPGGGQTQETPPPDARQQIMTGANGAAQTLGDILTEDSNRPITVYVHRGTTMGLLFMDSVTTDNAEK